MGFVAYNFAPSSSPLSKRWEESIFGAESVYTIASLRRLPSSQSLIKGSDSSLVDSDQTAPRHQVERRPFQRKRVLLNGIVVYANGSHSFECSFRNISPGGARIQIGRNMQFPSQFYLIAVRDQVAHQVQVVWNNGIEV